MTATSEEPMVADTGSDRMEASVVGAHDPADDLDRERRLIDHAMRQAGTWAPLKLPEIPGLRLIRMIRCGGQGAVYEAHQPSTQRIVVVKIFPSTLAGQSSERFHREVHVLGQLRHPNIVTIHDSGVVDGRCYVVMDLIRGVSLSAWAKEVLASAKRPGGETRAARRSERNRIVNLFATVCDAVNEAHLHGVIHRDLKPSNVLVDDNDQPYVLDFGLAKLSKADELDRTLTREGQFIGSLAWASPEQAALKPELIDVRTDVYSLGVLLYHAMTDRFPYDVDKGLHEVLADIMHAEPVPPRRANPRVDTDLETIILKCLAKEPARRYQNAGELGRDLRRYLEGAAIDARRDSTWYLVRKNLRRYRGPVIVGAAFVMMLTTGAALSTALYFKANEQRRLATIAEETARRRAEQLERVAAFQSSQLAEIDPVNMGLDLRQSLVDELSRNPDPTHETPNSPHQDLADLDLLLSGVNFTNLALDVLRSNIFERALSAIESDFRDQPLVTARLLQTVASTLRDIGLLDLATEPQDQAVVIRREKLGPDHPETLHSVSRRAYLLEKQGRLAEAEPIMIEALASYRRTLGADHPDTLAAINRSGSILHAMGRLEKAETYYREALAGRRRVLGEHPDTYSSINDLGRLLVAQGRFAEAEPYCREAVAGTRRLFGNEHPNTLSCLSNLGFLMLEQGRLAEAADCYRETLELSRRVLGDEHPDTLVSINSMCAVLHRLGEYAEAEPYCREALDARRRSLGDDHPNTLNSINNFAALLNGMSKHADAVALLTDSEPAARRTWSEQSQAHWLGIYLAKLGEAQTGTGNFNAAEATLLEAYPMLVDGFGPQHPATRQGIARLVALYEAWNAVVPHGGFDAKADAWNQRLRSQPDGTQQP